VLRAAAQEIHALPVTYRTPFELFLNELSHREIAETLGISVENARKRVQRARQLLQPRLAELFATEVEVGTSPRQAARAVERALSEIVTDHRIVSIALPRGGEMQLCLRVDGKLARREAEIENRRAELASRPGAWKQRLELAELCY